MIAKDILEALEQLHVGRKYNWVLFPEFMISVGYGYYSDRKIDLFAIHCHPSKRNERVAYEIKVSRSDFTREINNPMKRTAGMLFSNRFYFAAPRGLIKPAEIPDDCGLVEIEDGTPTIRLKAPYRESMNPTWPFVAMLARRVARIEMGEESWIP